MITTLRELERIKDDQQELILSVKSEVAESATVTVAWCLSKVAALGLVGRDLTRGSWYLDRLLISVQNGKEETSRQLVPLQDGLAHVQFHRPGLNIIHATIVRNCSPDRENDLLTKRQFREYNYLLYDHSGEFRANFVDGFATGSVGVEVPEGLFAKKPASWVWRLVNWWCETPPVDQCQFRRRAIFALPMAIFWGFAYLAHLLVALLLGLRWSRIDWLCRDGLPTSYLDWEDSFFLYRKKESWTHREKREERYPAYWPLIPAFPAGIFLIGCVFWFTRGFVKEGEVKWFVENFCSPRQLWWESLAIAGALSLLIVLIHGVTIAFCCLFYAIDWLAKLARTHRMLAVTSPVIALLKKIYGRTLGGMLKAREARRWQQGNRESDRRQRLRTAIDENELIALLPTEILPPEVAELVCTGQPRPLSVKELSPRRRTVRLRFSALKSQVCRPFAW